MTTYLLTQRACDFDLPPSKTVTAACIHQDDDFVRFHDADHQLVYAVQRGLLLAIETVEDEDQAAQLEPEPDTIAVLEVDGSSLVEAFRSAVWAASKRASSTNFLR